MGKFAATRPDQSGMTLVEFVTAISVSSLLIVGIHTSLFIALKGMPSPQGAAATAIQANRLLDKLATELESAVYVTELTSTTIAFSLPDRNADGQAERVRYTWSGTPGSALTRQYNGGALETLAAQGAPIPRPAAASTVSPATSDDLFFVNRALP